LTFQNKNDRKNHFKSQWTCKRASRSSDRTRTVIEQLHLLQAEFPLDLSFTILDAFTYFKSLSFPSSFVDFIILITNGAWLLSSEIYTSERGEQSVRKYLRKGTCCVGQVWSFCSSENETFPSFWVDEYPANFHQEDRLCTTKIEAISYVCLNDFNNLS
jgi:hypothetical protein